MNIFGVVLAATVLTVALTVSLAPFAIAEVQDQTPAPPPPIVANEGGAGGS